MSPEPEDLVSIFLGSPLYRISPEPETLAVNISFAVTLISADPEILAFTLSAIKS